MRTSHARFQRGAAAVEFALIFSVFITVLLGAMEMGRLLWTWNAAAEATRVGARTAVVCAIGSEAIRDRMREALPTLADENVVVDYLNPPLGVNTCTDGNCKAVRVTLTGYTHETFIPFVPLEIVMPEFQTTLPREYMNSDGANPQCA